VAEIQVFDQLQEAFPALLESCSELEMKIKNFIDGNGHVRRMYTDLVNPTHHTNPSKPAASCRGNQQV
jgi:hypothetical protein